MPPENLGGFTLRPRAQKLMRTWIIEVRSEFSARGNSHLWAQL